MRQVFIQRGKTQLKQVPLPLLGDNELLVRVHYSFISSGTEGATIAASGKSLLKKFTANITENGAKILGAIKEHGISGTASLIEEKKEQLLALGYSCAGQIIEVGKHVKRFNVGDFVACAGAGIANHADLVAAPENLTVKLSNKNYLKQASITTIGAIALQGVRRANLQLGEKVCVIGLGLIGQLTAQLVKLSGCQVFGVDISQHALDLAQAHGTDRTFNAATDDIVREITFATHHLGADVTIITAGSSSGELLQQAMLITRKKGKVVLVGDVKLDFDRDPFYAKEIDLLISCSYGPGRYDVAYERQGHDYPYAYVRWTENRNMELFARLVEEEKIIIQTLIGSEFDVADAEQAFQALRERKTLGVVLSYGLSQPEIITHSQDSLNSQHTITRIPLSEHIHAGIIGVGGFTKTKLLPIIASINNTTIASIIDTNQAQALTMAKLYGAPNTHNDYRALFNDEKINAVVIATPHGLHAQQTLDCLQQNLAVFAEKPAAVTFEQLELLKNYLSQNPQAPYCADFNRSFSPFMQTIKQVIQKRTNPLMISYRVNAGYLPQDHWIQSEEHRGRIIGEACHMFELFCFLTDAQPQSVSVEIISPRGNNLAKTDNVLTHVRMSDGSVCSLLYTALGNNALNKEYMELFFDGKSITMRDYVELKGFGLPVTFNNTLRNADKGHEALLKKFFNAIHTQQPMPIPFERIIAATELTLVVDHLARQGGGSQQFC